MLDIHTRIATLKRPKLLARAAHFGVDDYRRDVHLRRILQTETLPRNADAVMQLLDLEQEMDRARLDHDGNYGVARHVEILIAIAGEARLLQATRPQLVT